MRRMDGIIEKFRSLHISLVEVIIVIAIACILAGVLIPTFQRTIVDEATGESVRYAYIFKPDGSVLVEGAVDSSYINSDTGECRVTINGHTYRCDSDNLVLVDY